MKPCIDSSAVRVPCEHERNVQHCEVRLGAQTHALCRQTAEPKKTPGQSGLPGPRRQETPRAG